MTNNQSPDMPGEIFVFRNATRDLVCYDGHQSCSADVIYRRADLIKPEPVADLEEIRRDIRRRFATAWNESGACIRVSDAVNDAIDYLAAQGHLRPAVPREVIEKAYWALEYLSQENNGHIARSVCSIAMNALKPYVEGKE